MHTLFVRLVVVFGVAGLLAGCGGGGQTDSCDAGCVASGSGGAAGVGVGGAGAGTGGKSGTGGHSGVGGGASGPCTGTPTSSCAAANCDLLPGCSATAAGCTGTPTPCSASDNQSSACGAELGCAVPSDAGLCTNFYTACGDPEIGNDLNLCNSITGCHFSSGLCQGTIVDCTTITSTATCNGMSACNWTPATSVYCEGIPVACPDVPRSGCQAQAGCHLTTAVCTGTPTACADLSPAMCASQPGCVGGTAGGTGGTGGTTAVKLPDLVVKTMVAEKTTLQGQDVFHFGLEETNRGVADAAPHSVAVVLSPDNVIGNQDDVPLWTLTTTGPEAPFGLGTASWPAAYYAMTELVAAVPSSGYYYAGVILDSKNEVVESEETNNTAVSARLFIGTPTYDLRAVAVSTDATSPLAPGDALAVSVTVLNQSNIEVTSVPIDLLLSSDTVVDAADLRFCSTTATMTLEAGAQAVIPLSCTVPRLRGAYHLGAEVDPANTLAESDETNNSVVAAGTLTLAAPSPDLTAASVMTDITDVPWSGDVVFSADAHNGGVDPAGAFNVGFYLSANAVLDAADDLVCQVSVPGGLAAGAQTHVTMSCAIPALDSGTWRVIAQADSQDAVFETDETNNTAVAAATITVADPTWDLDSGVFSDDGGSTLSVGQMLNFQLTVSNPGTDSIPGFDADVVLSTDMTITSSDHLLCTVTLGAVPAQTEAGFAFSCQIPDTPAGTYYTGINLDPRNMLVETNEDNNTSVDTVPRAIAP